MKPPRTTFQHQHNSDTPRGFMLKHAKPNPGYILYFPAHTPVEQRGLLHTKVMRDERVEPIGRVDHHRPQLAIRLPAVLPRFRSTFHNVHELSEHRVRLLDVRFSKLPQRHPVHVDLELDCR